MSLRSDTDTPWTFGGSRKSRGRRWEETLQKKGKKLGSIKDGGGLRKKKGIDKAMNLGKLMRKYRDLEEVLYQYTVNSDFVYEDMDFSIEEFSDMTGADLEELLAAIDNAIRLR